MVAEFWSFSVAGLLDVAVGGGGCGGPGARDDGAGGHVGVDRELAVEDVARCGGSDVAEELVDCPAGGPDAAWG